MKNSFFSLFRVFKISTLTLFTLFSISTLIAGYPYINPNFDKEKIEKIVEFLEISIYRNSRERYDLIMENDFSERYWYLLGQIDLAEDCREIYRN